MSYGTCSLLITQSTGSHELCERDPEQNSKVLQTKSGVQYLTAVSKAPSSPERSSDNQPSDHRESISSGATRTQPHREAMSPAIPPPPLDSI